jgi:hypothetical protein
MNNALMNCEYVEYCSQQNVAKRNGLLNFLLITHLLYWFFRKDFFEITITISSSYFLIINYFQYNLIA